MLKLWCFFWSNTVKYLISGRARQDACRGVTLAEVMITIVALGVLASMAVPQYRKTVEQGYWRQAHAVLLTMYAGQRSYFLRNDFYHGAMFNCTAGNGMADWRDNMLMDDPNECTAPPTVSYNILAPVGLTVVMQATRIGGLYDGNVLSVTEDRIWGGDWGDPANQLPP